MCRSSGRCVVDEWLWWWRSLLWLGSHFQNKQPVRKVKTYCQGAGFMGMGLWELAVGWSVSKDHVMKIFITASNPHIELLT